MKSLRIKLAFLSAMISALIIAAFATTGSLLTRKLLLRSIDLQLAIPIDRASRELHPMANLEQIRHRAEFVYAPEIESGKLMLMIRDNVEGALVYQNPKGDWLATVDSKIWDIVETPPPPPNEPPPRPTDSEAKAKAKGAKGKGAKGKGPPPMPSAPPAITYFFVENELGNWRFGYQKHFGFGVLMGRELSDYHAENSKVTKLVIIGAPLGLLIAALGGWYVGHRAMRPLDQITAIASRIKNGRDLTERIPLRRGEYCELGHLISVLNDMMDRLEKGFSHAMRFSGDVSHELKTPITIMQAEVDTALKQCDPDSGQEMFLQTISRETHRLKSITGSLMLLSQAESGRLAIKTEDVHISNKVADLVEDAEILCTENQLALDTSIETNIIIQSDSTLIHQALLNLVSNAIKYNQPDGWIRIELAYHEVSSEAVFKISNSGPGIATDEVEHIFERFYRADKSRSRSVDGFGLGLNLSSQIIELLGGELELLRANTEATTFQARLPHAAIEENV